MNIENRNIEVGMGIFQKVQTPSGKWTYRQCTVLEIMEKPAALKVRYPYGERFLRAWFSASEFTFKVPSPEEQKKAATALAEKEAA